MPAGQEELHLVLNDLNFDPTRLMQPITDKPNEAPKEINWINKEEERIIVAMRVSEGHLSLDSTIGTSVFPSPYIIMSE